MRRILFLVLLAGCGDDSAAPIDAPDLPDAPPCTRCLDPHTLVNCDGSQTDCADRFCGPDPIDPAGAACIQSGDACGAIEYEGNCAGDILAYCSGAELTVLDCAALYGMCAFESPSVGFNCLTTCDVEHVPPEGVCNAAGEVERCEWREGGFVVVTETCRTGWHCGDVEESLWPGCIPDAPCAGVGPQGRCDAQTFVDCVDGNPQTTDCAAADRVCAFGGDLLGYGCVDPGTTGARLVSGVVRYEDRPATEAGLGAIAPRPARGATVALVDDATSQVLAAALTADDGSFMLRYDAADGTMVHLLAAASSNAPSRPVRVIRPDGRIHGFGGASFAVADSQTQDVLVSDASSESEAFNVFDQLVTGMDFVRTELAPASLTPMYAHWVRGTADGTYWFDPGMFLLGEALDDDGYDDAVICHEFGHYVEDYYSRDDSPGGNHDGSPTFPPLAWSEGFATWFSSAARGDTIYVDSNAGGGWSYDLESTVTSANPAGAQDQDVSEDTVSEILWDVGDVSSADDDPSSGGPGPVLAAAAGWFRSTSFDDRGEAGIDLVDWLDGWFVTQGLGGCAAVRTVVGSRGFPYDFGGPAGACP